MSGSRSDSSPSPPVETDDVESLPSRTSGLSLNSRTSTGSTTSSTQSSQSSHSSHSHSIRSLLPHKHHRSKSQSPYTFSPPTTPVQLAEVAISTLFSHPGPTLEELQTLVFPVIYWPAYVHRANSREYTLEGLAEKVTMLRSRFRAVRVRFKSSLMDSDGTATMAAAAVALTYDILAIPIGAKHGAEEEKRMPAVGIFKILDGKLAQSDVVLDTIQFHEENPKELSCVVM